MYKPLPSYVTIKQSKVNGLGLFALENIVLGTIIPRRTHTCELTLVKNRVTSSRRDYIPITYNTSRSGRRLRGRRISLTAGGHRRYRKATYGRPVPGMASQLGNGVRRTVSRWDNYNRSRVGMAPEWARKP